MKKLKKSQKKKLRKKLSNKETIIINGKPYTLPKELDEFNGKIKKQVFDKNAKAKKRSELKNKRKSPCIECEFNDQGFCRKFKQWCNICSNNCDPKAIKNVYVYRDENHKKHIIKY